MSLQGLYHFALNVRDLDRSEKFYTEIVGLQVRQRLNGGVFLTCSDADPYPLLVLNPAEKELEEVERPRFFSGRRPGMNHAAFLAESEEAVRAVYLRLKAAGVEKILPIDHGAVHSVYFCDPDGHTIEVAYRVPADEQREESVQGMQPWNPSDGGPS